MTGAERRETSAALAVVLDALVATGRAAASQPAAELRRQAGALAADTGAVEGWTFGTPLGSCFAAATAAGATVAGMDAVRRAAARIPAARGPVLAVTQTAVRLALVETCRILAATTFVSRQDVEAALALVNAGFEPAEAFAARRRAVTVYRALVGLRAAAVRDLTQRGRLLPQLVAYDLPRRVPALTLAQRLYADAARAGEIAAENKVIHPLFMPAAGRALSV